MIFLMLAVLGLTIGLIVVGTRVTPTMTSVAPVIVLTREISSPTGFVYGGQLETSIARWRLCRSQFSNSVGLSDSASISHDGVVFLFGGQFGAGELTSQIWRMKGATELLELLSITMPVARYRHAAAVLNGEVFIFGGKIDYANDTTTRRVDVLNLETFEWRRIADMPESRSDLNAIANVEGNEIFLLGGYADDYSSVLPLIKYSVASDAYSSGLSPLPTGRGDAAGALIGDRIHLVGGFSLENGFTSALTTHEAYAISSDSWTTLAPLRLGRGDASAVVIENQLWVLGGEAKGEQGRSIPLSDVDVFDTALNDWFRFLPLRRGFFRAAVALANDTLFAFGGHIDSVETESDECDAFETSQNVFLHRAL